MNQKDTISNDITRLIKIKDELLHIAAPSMNPEDYTNLEEILERLHNHLNKSFVDLQKKV